MADMSMNLVIHAAFRRDLDRFASALDKLGDDQTARAGQLQKAWANFYTQLDVHHHGEHEIAWPALAAVGVPADTLAQMDTEHEAMSAALAKANTAFAALGSPGSTAHARTALAALRTSMLTHLDHEEAALEKVYQDNKDTPELKAMGRQFAKTPPWKAGPFFAWVQDGASADELSSLRASVPPPVLMLIPLVFGRSYTKGVAPVWRG